MRVAGFVESQPSAWMDGEEDGQVDRDRVELRDDGIESGTVDECRTMERDDKEASKAGLDVKSSCSTNSSDISTS
jgi:hypothetical protein